MHLFVQFRRVLNTTNVTVDFHKRFKGQYYLLLKIEGQCQSSHFCFWEMYTVESSNTLVCGRFCFFFNWKWILQLSWIWHIGTVVSARHHACLEFVHLYIRFVMRIVVDIHEINLAGVIVITNNQWLSHYLKVPKDLVGIIKNCSCTSAEERFNWTHNGQKHVLWIQCIMCRMDQPLPRSWYKVCVLSVSQKLHYSMLCYCNDPLS